MTKAPSSAIILGYIIANMSEYLERNENVTTIKMPTGQVNVAYGDHSKEQPLPEGMETLMSDSDYLFLEYSDLYYQAPDIAIDHLSKSTQYGELIEAAKESGTEIVLSDLFVKSDISSTDIKRTENIASVLETLAVLGAANAYTRFNKKREEKETTMTRRRVLGGILATLGTAWATSPILSSASRTLSLETGIGHGASANYKKMSNMMHPESFDKIMMTLREMVMAYKLIKMFEETKDVDPNFKQTATLVIGALHVGIEDIFADYSSGKLTVEMMEDTLNELKENIDNLTYGVAMGYFFDEESNSWQTRIIQFPKLLEQIGVTAIAA